jgi:uncharacterized membrane protein YqaE (UPF0057 family)
VTVLEIIIALFFPPLAVFLATRRISGQFWLSVLLWLLGHIPGVIYALYVITTDGRASRRSSAV